MGLNTPGGNGTQVRHMRAISIQTDGGWEDRTGQTDRQDNKGRQTGRERQTEDGTTGHGR